jgi:hypothetical protein
MIMTLNVECGEINTSKTKHRVKYRIILIFGLICCMSTRGKVHFDELHVDFVRALVRRARLLVDHRVQFVGSHEHDSLRAAFAKHGERFTAGIEQGVKMTWGGCCKGANRFSVGILEFEV